MYMSMYMYVVWDSVRVPLARSWSSGTGAVPVGDYVYRPYLLYVHVVSAMRSSSNVTDLLVQVVKLFTCRTSIVIVHIYPLSGRKYYRYIRYFYQA